VATPDQRSEQIEEDVDVLAVLEHITLGYTTIRDVPPGPGIVDVRALRRECPPDVRRTIGNPSEAKRAAEFVRVPCFADDRADELHSGTLRRRDPPCQLASRRPPPPPARAGSRSS
jgi:hypothetical protein